MTELYEKLDTILQEADAKYDRAPDTEAETIKYDVTCQLLYICFSLLRRDADAVNARGLSRVLMDISERVALIDCLKASE